MRVLVTGGTGYIGSHICVVLTAAQCEVVLYDNLCNSTAKVVDRLEKICGKRPQFVQGDIRDTALLLQTLKDHRIDAVIHCAGLKAVGESGQIPIDYYANNLQGTISVLQAMRDAGTRTLVFSSSATVYGAPHYLPLDESHPTSATNPYGRTKLQIEEMLADVAASDPSWRIACLRYFNPTGAHSSGLIGDDPSGLPNNLMPYVARVANGTLPQVQVHGQDYDTPDGTGVRDYLHVMDLAEGHLAAVRYLDQHSGWSVFNLGTGRGFSVLEMIKAFEKACGHNIAYQVGPRRPGDIASCYAEPKKAAELLGWRAERGIDEMCASTWHYQQQAARQA